MVLFDTLPDRNHICAMDNLYNSATFFSQAYTHEKKSDGSWSNEERDARNLTISQARRDEEQEEVD